MNLSLTDNERKLLTKFDTCFFERYAKLTLQYFLGSPYNELINKDRPDLQLTDGSLGIEVTRAMKESKIEAIRLVNELAAEDVIKIPKEDTDDIKANGYAYGISAESNNVGHLEYDYWKLALPLKRIIESKVHKVMDGFYGDFDVYGLYIFSKDDMTDDEIVDTLEYLSALQKDASRYYSKVYISQVNQLYVCDTQSLNIDKYSISDKVCRAFYHQAII